MRVTLIHNPTAGDRIASADALRSMLEDAGYRVRVASTKGKWSKALKPRADLVVAAGGDGTARRVALALAEDGRDVPIAVLPLGTANNLGKALGAVGNAREIIGAWLHASPRPLDLGVAELDGKRVRFIESAGAGLFAELIRVGAEAVEQTPVFVGRETDRMLLLMAACARDAPVRHWGVEVDGRDCSGRYVGVEILNVRFGGPNVPLAPAADTGDGRLDVALIDEAGRDRLIEYAERRLHLGAAELPPIVGERGERIVVRVPEGAPIHVDDRLPGLRGRDGRRRGSGSPDRGLAGERRLEITVEAGALRVLGQPR